MRAIEIILLLLLLLLLPLSSPPQAPFVATRGSSSFAAVITGWQETIWRRCLATVYQATPVATPSPSNPPQSMRPSYLKGLPPPRFICLAVTPPTAVLPSLLCHGRRRRRRHLPAAFVMIQRVSFSQHGWRRVTFPFILKSGAMDRFSRCLRDARDS